MRNGYAFCPIRICVKGHGSDRIVPKVSGGGVQRMGVRLWENSIVL